MSKSKYHHLIPKTYFSAWANGSGTLQIKRISGEIEERNKDNIAGIKHYHSIIAGMPFCEKTDTDQFFAILKSYTVKYNGQILNDSLEMNKFYGAFDEWKITRQDGTVVSKRGLKHQIDQVKIRDIEEQWSVQYENKWSERRINIEDKVLKTADNAIEQFRKGYLMRFFTMLDWRSTLSNEQFIQMYNFLGEEVLKLDAIDIPADERQLSIFETASDYLKHCLLLSTYRKFLRGSGMMHDMFCASMHNTSFNFLVAGNHINFITSDNPAFVDFWDEDKKVGLLPITPKILMMQVHRPDNDPYYYISRVDDRMVEKCNHIIAAVLLSPKHFPVFVLRENL